MWVPRAWRRVAVNLRWVLVAWLATLLFALPVALPLFRALESELSPTLAAGPMLAGGDVRWYGDFRREHQHLLGDLGPALSLASEAGLGRFGDLFATTGLAGTAAVLALAFWAWTAILGGALATVVLRSDATRAATLGELARGGAEMARRFLLSASLLLFLGWLAYRWIYVFGGDYFELRTEGLYGDEARAGVIAARLALTLLAWCTAWAWIDYARVLMVRERRGLLHALWGSAALLRRRPLALGVRWLRAAAPAALIPLAWIALTWGRAPVDGTGLAALALAQQLIVMLRLAARLYCWSACSEAVAALLPPAAASP